MRNLQVIGKAFLDAYENMFVLLLANLLVAIAAALPLSAIVGLAEAAAADPASAGAAPYLVFLAALILVLLAGPPTYALAVMLRRVTDLESFSLRDYLGAIRVHALRSWLMGSVGLIGTSLCLINLNFYATLGGWATMALPLFLAVTMYWLLMLLFLFPLAVLTEGGPLRVLRNAAIVVIRHPGLSLVTGLATVVVLVASTALVIPWLILTTGVVLALSTRAVRSAVRRDFALPEDDPISDEPLPPIAADQADPLRGRPHYGWQSARQEADPSAPSRPEA